MDQIRVLAKICNNVIPNNPFEWNKFIEKNHNSSIIDPPSQMRNDSLVLSFFHFLILLTIVVLPTSAPSQNYFNKR
jgi:hypothetical protein